MFMESAGSWPPGNQDGRIILREIFFGNPVDVITTCFFTCTYVPPNFILASYFQNKILYEILGFYACYMLLLISSVFFI